MASIDGPKYPGIQDGLIFCFDPKNRDCWNGGWADGESNFTSLVNNISGSGVNMEGDEFNGTITTEGYLYFAGDDDYVDIETSVLSHISNVSTFSIGMWAKPKLSSDFFSMGYAIGTHTRMNFGTWNDGNMYLNIGETGGTTGCSLSRAYSNWDNWSYWVCTYDKSQGSFSERLKGYIDGVDPGSWGENGNSGNNTGTITGFYLGYLSQWSSYANGELGPIQIYNRALSAGEVLTNYNRLKGRFGL